MWCLNGPDSGSPCQLCAERKAQTANQGWENWWAAEGAGAWRRGRGRTVSAGREKLSTSSFPAESRKGVHPDTPSSSQGNRRQFELSSSVPPGSLAAAASSLGLGREPRLAYRTRKSLSAHVLPSAWICAEPIFLILRRMFTEGAARGTWLRYAGIGGRNGKDIV